MQTLHARKSHLLATGNRAGAQSLRTWEEKIEQLRERGPLGADFHALLENPELAKKRLRVLPEGLFRIIPREKMERYDRYWESTLAGEACAIGWNLWVFEAWVQIMHVESWDRRTHLELWPSGVVLFVDSANDQKTSGVPEGAWHGKWYVAMNPSVTDPATNLPIDVNKWEGITYLPESAAAKKPFSFPSPAQPCLWKLVYVSKKI
jgi:hypothetical protein